MSVFARLSSLFLSALWSSVGKELAFWLSCMCFYHFPIRCSGSGVCTQLTNQDISGIVKDLNMCQLLIRLWKDFRDTGILATKLKGYRIFL